MKALLSLCAFAALILCSPLTAQIVNTTDLSAKGFSSSEVVGDASVSGVAGMAPDPRDRDAVYYFNDKDGTLRRHDFADSANVVIDTLADTVYGTAVVVDSQAPDALYLLHSGNFSGVSPIIIRYTLDATDRSLFTAKEDFYIAQDWSASSGPNLSGYIAYDAGFTESMGTRPLVISEHHSGTTDVVELRLSNSGYDRDVLVSVPGSSGAITFGPDGTLYYAFPSDSAFTAENQVQIMSWSKGQLDGVRNGGFANPLTEADGTIIRSFDPTPGNTPDWHTIPFMTARDEGGDRVLYCGIYEGKFVGPAITNSLARLNLASGVDDLEWHLPLELDTVAGEAQSNLVSPSPHKLVFTSQSGSFAGFDGQWDENSGEATAILYGSYTAFGGFPNFPSEASLFRIEPTNATSEIQEIGLNGSTQDPINVQVAELFTLEVSLLDAGENPITRDIAASLNVYLAGSGETIFNLPSVMNTVDGRLTLSDLHVDTPGSYTLRVEVIGGLTVDRTLNVHPLVGDRTESTNTCQLSSGSVGSSVFWLLLAGFVAFAYWRRWAIV